MKSPVVPQTGIFGGHDQPSDVTYIKYSVDKTESFNHIWLKH
jgi:hypothetical protein